MMCSSTTSGWAYTSPSRAGDCQILCTWPIGVWSSATPVRPASWWYVVHSVAGATVADLGAVVDVVDAVPPIVGVSDFGFVEHAASPTATSSAATAARADLVIECRGAVPTRSR